MIKSILRPLRELFLSCCGFFYDFYRFARYSGYRRGMQDDQKRDYKAVKTYHKLEKSLAFRNRDKHSGGQAVEELISLLKAPNKDKVWGFHEVVALKVLDEFEKISVIKFQKPIFEKKIANKTGGGTLDFTTDDLFRGKLQYPEEFFFSRYSVRDFSSKNVSPQLIKRALNLASKTPSVCNRQSWYVYHTDSREIIDSCLSFQNGNKGFGHEVPSLLMIAVDLKAFDRAGERYQHWIDGGMFAMSIIYALHSLGLASCCLNWSKTPRDDLMFRKEKSIKSHHSIIMMLAIGYPKDDFKVCYSARKPIESIYEYWG